MVVRDPLKAALEALAAIFEMPSISSVVLVMPSIYRLFILVSSILPNWVFAVIAFRLLSCAPAWFASAWHL